MSMIPILKETVVSCVRVLCLCPYFLAFNIDYMGKIKLHNILGILI